MSFTVVRYQTKPDRADENQAFVEKVYAELHDRHPEGLRYMTLRLDDGVTFVHIASVDTDDGRNPLQSVAAFAEFQAEVADRCVEGPAASSASVVGSFGFTS